LGDAIFNRILKEIENHFDLNRGDAIFIRILEAIQNHDTLDRRSKIAAPEISD
jgi:hypothetical protein